MPPAAEPAALPPAPDVETAAAPAPADTPRPIEGTAPTPLSSQTSLGEAPAPAETPRQRLAALPPAVATAPIRFPSVGFPAGETVLDPAAENDLAELAANLGEDGRIQLKGYATAADPSSARRVALARALAVRTFLIERGIRGNRIDIRALGAAEDGGPAERVDVVPAPR